MKHITIVVILVGMTLLTACESRSDRARAMAEEAGLPEEGFARLDEDLVSLGYTLISLEEIQNLEEIRDLEELAVLQDAEEAWCVVVRLRDNPSLEILLMNEVNHWLSRTLGSSIYSEPIIQAVQCSNWE